MIPRAFDDIDGADVQSLITNQVSEGRTLEYKRDLPTDSNDGRREFLADVTSFANAQGGDIIYGLAEANGAAAHIHGVDVENPDQALLGLEERILAGAEPRMPGVRFKWVTVETQRLLVIRIPSSPIAPHRVVVARSGKFFGRKSNGKYEMDTQELREAFTATEALPTRLRALHLEAVDMAQRDEWPAWLGEGPKAIVSVIPMNFFRERLDLEITPEIALAPFKPGGRVEAIEMMEGVVLHTDGGSPSRMGSYAITYRSGRTDMVWEIGFTMDELQRSEAHIVPFQRFKEGLIDGTLSAVGRLRSLSIEGPWVVFTSVAGIRDYILLIDNDHYSEPAWRRDASLPDVVGDRLTTDSLSPVFKSMWRLFGMRPPMNPKSI